MNKNTITIVVIGLLIAGLFFYIGSKFSITGNVVNTDSKKIINSEPKEDQLLQENKAVSKVNYQVKVKDKFTKENLGYADVYLDGKLSGKTSSDGELIIEDADVGRHNLRALYKGEESDVLTKDITEFDNNIIIYITAPRTITLELKDSETNKPVDNENVFLKSSDGKANFNPILTTNEGKAQFNDVLPRDYVISIERFPNKPADMVTIGANNFITAKVDMPNPRFKGSINCGAQKSDIFELEFDNYRECEITLKNEDYERGMDSEDTTIVLYVYGRKKEGDFVKVDEDILDFGEIKEGETESKITKKLYGFSSSHTEEKIVAAVYDGWKYLPEDTSQIGGVSISQSLKDKFIIESINWCANNIGECAEGAKKVVGIIAVAV